MGCLVVCKDGTPNTGVPSGSETFGDIVGFITVPLVADDGTVFKIPYTQEITAQFISDLLNNPDVSKRGIPVMGLENVNAPPGDPIVTTYESGKTEPVSDGIRSFAAIMPLSPAPLVGQLKRAGRCREMGILPIDSCGNLKGDTKEDQFIKPLKVSTGTWNAILNWATATVNQNISLTFEFDRQLLDEKTGWFTSEAISADILNIKGLIDINLVEGSATASNDTILIKANSLYIPPVPKIIDVLEQADFAVSVNDVATTLVSATLVGQFYELVTTVDFLATDDIIVSGSKTGFELQPSEIIVAAV